MRDWRLPLALLEQPLGNPKYTWTAQAGGNLGVDIRISF